MTRFAALRRVAADRSGTAVIEFAITAPLLALLLLGMFDVAPTLMVRFKLSNATQAVADLATQSSTVQTSDLANFIGAGADVMVPFSDSPLSLRISNIASDGSGNAFVYWSCASGSFSPKTAKQSVSSLITGVQTKDILLLTHDDMNIFHTNGTNTSMIMVESTYTYRSPVGLIFPSPQVITNTAFAMPRVSTYVGPTSGSSNYTPTAPTNTKFVYSVVTNGVSCSIAL